jgi:hypothetical protein
LFLQAVELASQRDTRRQQAFGYRFKVRMPDDQLLDAFGKARRRGFPDLESEAAQKKTNCSDCTVRAGHSG